MGHALANSRVALAREQRPFCLWAQADADFDSAVNLIPREWSKERKALWRTRLEIIRDNEHIRRIEQPVYKRRWGEQWKIGNSWQCGQPAYDAEFLEAFDWWLSEKAEWWLEHKKKGGPVAVGDWAEKLWEDERIQAAWEVAAEVQTRLDAWKAAQKGEPGASATGVCAAQTPGNSPVADAPGSPASFADFLKRFKKLVKEQSAPEDIPFAEPWEQIEKKRKVPAYVKSLRGKLNVPRERFWSTAEGFYKTPKFFE